MKILDLFRRPKRNTAQLAKERLQIIVSHESSRRAGPDIVRQMQQELLEVICKYVHIDQDKIKVQLERHGDQSVLELNVTLPDGGLVNLKAPKKSVQSEGDSLDVASAPTVAVEKSNATDAEVTNTKSETSAQSQKNKKKASDRAKQAEA